MLTLTRGLTMQVREGTKVQHQRPAEDFELFTFKEGSQVIMSAYVGNQPNFPMEKDTQPILNTLVNGLRVESVVHRETNGLALHEVLFHLQESNAWPQRLHCWYNVSTNGTDEIQELLSSVRFKK